MKYFKIILKKYGEIVAETNAIEKLIIYPRDPRDCDLDEFLNCFFDWFCEDYYTDNGFEFTNYPIITEKHINEFLDYYSFISQIKI